MLSFNKACSKYQTRSTTSPKYTLPQRLVTWIFPKKIAKLNDAKMNLVTHIISIIKKERVYYHWNAYKITFFTVHFFSGIFSVNGWCDHLTQDWKIIHVSKHELLVDILRANVCNFREWVDSREFLNFFIFCSNNLYSTLISKITLKLVSAFYFFRNRRSFEYEITENGAFSSRSYIKTE